MLAGVSIATLTGDSGIITKANEAELSTELSGYKEQLELYKVNKYSENSNFIEETLTAGKTELNYNTKESGETGNIKTIITNISDEYFEKLEVIKGELLINTKDKNEIKVAQRLGIEVNPYDITEDGVLLSSNGNLLLMDESTGSLTIPDSVTAIGEGAFANVEGLKTIIIPSTVKRIEKNAFRNNTTLETVIMQEKENEDGSIEGVEYIGDAAFNSCRNLKTVQMANSVTEISAYVFYDDIKLSEINISDKLKIINSGTFGNCKSLIEIEIPDGVISIAGAFVNCLNLTTVKIPKSVTTIDTSAFDSCPKLTNIDLSDNTNFRFENGILLGKNGTEMIIILSSAVSGNTFKVPDTVTTLSNGQLNKFTNITKIEIPASVNSISPTFITNNITEVEIDSNNKTYETDGKAIYTKNENNKTLVRYYKNEDSVNIEKQIKKIGWQAFNSKSLNSIELPDTLETIESQAFTGCNNLKSIELGVNVKSLDNMSIYGSGIEKIIFKEDSEGNTNPNYSIRRAKCNGEETEALFNSDGTEFISPIKRSVIKTYEIPKGVKEIANYAFHASSQMINIIIPNTVEKIGGSFNYCSSLTSIEIPSSVKEIDKNCFANSTNLKEIRIHKKNDGTLIGSPWGCIYGDKAIIWDE